MERPLEAPGTKASRGDLYRADLGEGLGKKIVLVVSWDAINTRLAEPIVCLVTAKERYRSLETYVPVDPPEGGLWKPSFILCHAMVTIEEWRLDPEPLGTLSRRTMIAVGAALRLALDLDQS